MLLTKHIRNERSEIETVGFHSSHTELLDDSAKKTRGTFLWTATHNVKNQDILLKNKQKYWNKPGHKL